jgi:hypothetical protein
MNEKLLTSDYYLIVSNFLPQVEMTSDGNEPSIRPELRGSPVGITRKAQELAGGNVQGNSETAGFATNKGEVVAPFAAGVPVTTIAGSGSFTIKSEGAGRRHRRQFC